MRSEAWHQVVLDNRDLVCRIASMLKGSLPAMVARDDLVAAGDLGLCQAARAWDPVRSRGGTFRTYAACRIRGEMLDYLREMDECGRGMRASVKAGSIEAPVTISIHEEVGPERDGRSPARLIDLIRGPNGCPVEHASRNEFPRLPVGLTQAERMVVELYYREGLTMRAVARRLGVCESRVSKLHSSAIGALRLWSWRGVKQKAARRGH